MFKPVEITPTGLEKILFLIVFAIGLVIFIYEIFFYTRLLKLLKSEKRWDNIGARIGRLFKFVFGQRRLLDQFVMGIAHFMIFWGFVIISFATLNFFGKGFWSGFELPVLGGALHEPFLFLVDLFSLLVLVGIIIALIKRYIIRAKRMSMGLEPLIILILIGGLMIFDLLSDAFNMAAQGSFEPAAFAGTYLAKSFLSWSFSPGSLDVWAHIFWWAHMLFFLTMLNYVPVSKHMHVFTSLPNVFFSSLKPNGRLTKRSISKTRRPRSSA
jgi:nitrate reductase gamma subunit